MELTTLNWKQVKPIWDTELWPGRDSEPVTSMKYLGGYDLSLKHAEPFFIGVVSGDRIVSVNSYVSTKRDTWRSRGLWVDPAFRRMGHARTMLEFMLGHIRTLGGVRVWTMPRVEALVAYQSVGFIRTTDWSEHDWGNNCYAMMNLQSLNDIGREAIRLNDRRISFYRERLRSPIEDRGVTTEEARQLMKPLADLEEGEWR
jgi:GNAT superfamily N-acetyltransferase